MSEVRENMVSIQPPKEIFKFQLTPISQAPAQRQVQYIHELERVESPKEGGIYAYFDGVPFPEKGWPTEGAVYACGMVKRYFIEQAIFLAKRPLFLVSFLSAKARNDWFISLERFGKIMLMPHFYKDNYYSNFSKQIRSFLEVFFREIGFRDHLMLPLILTTLLEYDRSYRYRIEDIFSETSKEKLSKSPRREILRLLNVYLSREPKSHLQEKFSSVAKITLYLLLFPKVKRAFRKALNVVEFKYLQLDEADRYHVLPFSNYNFFGLSNEIRWEAYIKYHGGKAPQMYEIKGDLRPVQLTNE